MQKATQNPNQALDLADIRHFTLKTIAKTPWPLTIAHPAHFAIAPIVLVVMLIFEGLSHGGT